MKSFNITLFFSIILIFPSCKNNSRANDSNKNVSKEKTYAREPNDSADYKKLKYDFYVGKDSQLYERKLAFAGDGRDTSCNCEFLVYYDNKISIDSKDAKVKTKLNLIIDINSFTEIDHFGYSKDRNRVYYFYGNSDGGNRVIVKNADPKTFNTVNNKEWDAKDKNCKYLNGEKVE